MHSGLSPKQGYHTPTGAPRVRALVAFLGGILAATAAACGSVPAQGFRGAVKIGLVAPFSGPEWSVGYEALFAARAAVNRWNLEDRGRGLRAELVAEDDRSTAEFGRLQAEKLAADPRIVAAVGHPSWASLSAAMRVYRQAGLALVNYWVPALPTDGPVYYLAPPWSRFETAAAQQLGPAGRLVVSFDPNACPWVGLGHGVGGNFSVTYLGAAPNPGSLPPGTEGVLICADGITAARWASMLGQAGQPAAGLFLGPPAYSPGLRNLLGSTRAAVLVPTWRLPAEEFQAFAAAFRNAGGAEPGPAAVGAYQATRLVLQAVEQAAAGADWPDRDRVRAALQTLSPGGDFDRAGVGLVSTGL
jgi:ABC-type branched-subunit amino acid transport system substrate-binding protein